MTLITPTRSFVLEGAFDVKLNSESYSYRQLFLFNDILLICKNRSVLRYATLGSDRFFMGHE
jgi:hypothetical protein